MKNLLFIFYSLLLCFVFACGSAPETTPEFSLRAKPKPERKTKKKITKKVKKRDSKKFTVKCLSMIEGCSKVQELEKDKAKAFKLWKEKTKDFTYAFQNLKDALNVPEYSPKMSIDHDLSTKDFTWKTLETEVDVNVKVRLKLHSIKGSLTKKNYNRVVDAMIALHALRKKWSAPDRKIDKTIIPKALLTYFKESSVKIPCYEDGKGFKKCYNSMYVPSSILEQVNIKQPKKLTAYIALVNNKHGLNHHIVDEAHKEVAPFFSFEENSGVFKLSIRAKSKVIKTAVNLSTPIQEICSTLRVEGRIENVKKVRKVRKAITTKIEQYKKEFNVKAKSKPLIDQVVNVFTMIEKNDIQYSPKKKSIKVNEIKYPIKKKLIDKILESVTTKVDAEKRLCIRHNKQIFWEQKGNDKSFKRLLETLGINPSMLNVEESLSFAYMMEDKTRIGFAEPSDLGSRLFDVLKKRSNAILKLTNKIQEIPYLLKLKTDTGKKISLPIEVDGLKSKRVLPKGTSWRLVGSGNRFTLNPQLPLHQKFLLMNQNKGMAKIQNIKYKKEYRDYTTPWSSLPNYEIHITGNRDSWLGKILVQQNFRLWFHPTDECDFTIDIELEESNEFVVDDDVMENPSLVKKIEYNPPNSPFVLGYTDAPICK